MEEYQVPKEEHVEMLQEKIKGCVRGILSLTIDAKAAEISGNVKGMEKIEAGLSATMKQKAAYEQLLKEMN